ncbi:MAG: response regulator transcription factor [Planctomycetia bacterium]|nr:response regulator transcription factor [Planctomycetia bacterium]
MMSSPREHVRGHILIVEDEAHLALGMRYTLEQEQYRVTVAHDGTSALELVLKNPDDFDMIVLDIMLPGMNGYKVCGKIRENNIFIPIMILSVRTLPEDRAKAFEAGANQYLSKPFELDEFLARIRNLLDFRRKIQSYQGNDAEVERETEKEKSVLPETKKIGNFGDAHVDFETFEVTVRNQNVRLTALEMALLAYFYENQNRLISKEELLENVWKMPGDLNTRAPDQFILRLRKIFEPDPTRPVHFLTYRNAGYRFIKEP